jgi:hypothetical protein
VPRAKPFTRSDVKQRSKSTRVDRNLIDRLTQKASLIVSANESFAYQLRQAIWAYRAKTLANKQEHPAKIVAALKVGLKHSQNLSEWLNSLPSGVRLELRAGGIEGLLDDLAVLLATLTAKIKAQASYWQSHVKTHRPAGEGEASLCLRWSLTEIPS